MKKSNNSNRSASKKSRKHQKPDEAVFDDEKELELERIAGMYDPDTPDIRTGMDSGAASAGEMTGIRPAGGDMTGVEYDGMKDVFPFGEPNILPR